MPSSRTPGRPRSSRSRRRSRRPPTASRSPCSWAPLDSRSASARLDPRLQDDEDEGDRDEDRDDRRERGGRQDEERAAPPKRAEQRPGAEPQRARALARELPPVADRPRDRARHEADRVRDVRGDRGIAEGGPHREGDQGAAADHRVDGPSRQPREADGEDLADIHRGIVGARDPGLEPLRTMSPKVTGTDAFTTDKCARPGSNRRPSPCKGDALPLSYARVATLAAKRPGTA